jgi:hypothetical protein
MKKQSPQKKNKEKKTQLFPQPAKENVIAPNPH